ncbi:hypothetical protein [Streptomyces sp. NPDC001292]|uniref:hypothetical protein n=1 Tax=Streptomyces sp. NPDC001292 TaxID=3364558 RepID=UPI00368E5CB7
MITRWSWCRGGGGHSRAGDTLAEPLRAQLSELCLDPPHVALSTLGGESVASAPYA